MNRKMILNIFCLIIGLFLFAKNVNADTYSYSWAGDYSISNGTGSVSVSAQYGMYGNQVNITKVSTDYQYLRFYNTDWHFDANATSFLISGILMGKDGSMQMDRIVCEASHTNEDGISECTIYSGIVHHTISIDVIAYYNNDFYASHCKTNFTEQGYFLAECPVIGGMRGMSSIKVSMANSYIDQDFSVFLGLTREITWVRSAASVANQKLESINQNQQQTNEKLNEANQNLSQTKDFITSDDAPSSDISVLGNVTGIFPQGPADSLLNIPFKFLSIVTSSFSGTCKPIETGIWNNVSVFIPCFDNIYDNVPDWLMIYLDLIPAGYILIRYLKYLYKKIERAQSLNTNSDDEWGVL